MIKRGDYRAAAIESRTIAGLALEGLTYYDTYDQARLRNIVSLGYLSFSIYTLLYIRHVFGTSTPSRIVPMNTLALNTLSISLGILVLAGAAVERSPWHALYAAFPIYLVRAIIINLWETSGGAVLGDLTAGIFVTRLGQLGGFSLALIAMAVCIVLAMRFDTVTMLISPLSEAGLSTSPGLVLGIHSSRTDTAGYRIQHSQSDYCAIIPCHPGRGLGTLSRGEERESSNTVNSICAT
jgi:hypothetical protein